MNTTTHVIPESNLFFIYSFAHLYVKLRKMATDIPFKMWINAETQN